MTTTAPALFIASVLEWARKESGYPPAPPPVALMTGQIDVGGAA